MKNTYIVVGPHQLNCGVRETWIDAVDRMADLSLKVGNAFRVVQVEGTALPYPRERRRVLNDLAEYVNLYKENPKSLLVEVARRRYVDARANLHRLMMTYRELEDTEFFQRCNAKAAYPRTPVQ